MAEQLLHRHHSVVHRPPAAEVGAGQQNLRGRQAMLSESLLIGLHQHNLSDCGCGLLFVQQLRTGRIADTTEAGGYRSGGYQQHLTAILL
ncbi:hypothetical protein D3C75_467340 [compost metagenome]